MNRVDLISEIFRLKREGKSIRKIGVILNVPKSQVHVLSKEAREISNIVTGNMGSEYPSNDEMWTRLFPKYVKKRLKGASKFKVATKLGLYPEIESEFNIYFKALLIDEIAEAHQILSDALKRSNLSIPDSIKILIDNYRRSLKSCRQKNIKLEDHIAGLEDEFGERDELEQMYIGVKAAYSEYVSRVLTHVSETKFIETSRGYSIQGGLEFVLDLLSTLSREAVREAKRLEEENWLSMTGRAIKIAADVKRDHDYIQSLFKQL